jgi:hypothetical protein
MRPATEEEKAREPITGSIICPLCGLPHYSARCVDGELHYEDDSWRYCPNWLKYLNEQEHTQ